MKLLFILVIMISAAAASEKKDCGKQKSVHPLIFGGTAVNVGDFPWVVPLIRKFNDKFFCGSNLISHQAVLTAAHCINEKKSTKPLTANEIYAYVGRFDLTQTVYERNSIKADIKKIIVHPNWSSEELRYDADIAILMLKNSVEYSDNIQPVCLPTPQQQVFEIYGIVVGYGKSESDTLHENRPRKVEISSYTNDVCFFSDYEFARFGSPRTFCAGEKGKTPCQGDSGSGFYPIDARSPFTIVGLVSSATVQRCGDNDFVLFTNVAKFTDWIQREIANTNDNDALESAFNEFDQDPNDVRNVVDAECRYGDTGSSAYACYINGLTTPDKSNVELRIQRGQHMSKRTNRDVTGMQVIGGSVPRFPGMSDVLKTFPNLNGFAIAFAKLQHIDRSKLKNLSQLKYFLVSDNEIEMIPADTFYDLKNLELIDICRNKIKNLDPAWTSTMPKLRIFKARSNKFQYVPANMFKRNPRLEEILFDYNELQRIDANFDELKSLKALRILKNACIDMEYCVEQSNQKCVRSLKQFSLLVRGQCGNFSN